MDSLQLLLLILLLKNPNQVEKAYRGQTSEEDVAGNSVWTTYPPRWVILAKNCLIPAISMKIAEIPAYLL